MSMTKSLIVCGFQPSRKNYYPSQTNTTSLILPLNSVAVNKIPGLFLEITNRSVHQNNGTGKRRFGVCNVVEPGVPLPSDQPFNLLQCIVGVAAVIFPFLTHKWASLLQIKNNVDTAVEAAEEIVEVVEHVAEAVEKVAEDIADDLPEDGNLRRAVDFVEHLAEKASDDAHLVGDFIDKVQEFEERVEEYAESWVFEKKVEDTHDVHNEPQNVTEKNV